MNDFADARTLLRMTTQTMLDKVAAKLEPLKGSRLFAIAEQTGISYDTILRIRDHKVDPAFSKVQTLAEHFHIVRGEHRREGPSRSPGDRPSSKRGVK